MNKRVLIISGVLLFILGLVTCFGAYTWYMSKPDPRGYVHSLEAVPEAQRELAVEQCNTVGHSDAVLGKIVDDLGLVSEFNVADRAAAMDVLKEKVYVELTSDINAMVFMVKGKRKDKAFTESVAKSFYMETLKAMTPAKNEF